jgi:hypothetical protein
MKRRRFTEERIIAVLREQEATDDRLRQRHRVHLKRNPGLGEVAWGRMTLYRAGQTDADRLHRVLQRPDARRASQRKSVCRSGSRPPAHRRLGHGLQHRKAAFVAGLQHPSGLCRHTHRAQGRNVGRGSNRRWMKTQRRSETLIATGWVKMSGET